MAVVTATELRNRWCFGLPLTKEDGAAMPDEDLAAYIESAEREVERRLGVYLTPHTIVAGEDEPPYDYNYDQYRMWGFLQLRHRPVISIERLRLILPNYQQVVEFPKEWIKLYPKAGQLHIVPMAGSPTVMMVAAGSGSAFPLLTGNLARNLPQCIWADYTAGFAECPADVKAIVAKIAAVDVLGIAGDAILAGIASKSIGIDGLSESVSTTASATNATYGARILQLQREIDAFFDPKKGGARQYYKGFTMAII